MPADPHDPRPNGRVKLKLTGTMIGVPVELLVDADVRKLPATITYIQDQGFAVDPRPIVWSHDADGRPICPKHGVPMRRHEKQGDAWHSHSVTTDAAGTKLWCRGFPGPESPGYHVLMPAEDPERWGGDR